MKYLFIVSILCLSVFAAICNAGTLFSQLQCRNGLYYKLNSDQPSQWHLDDKLVGERIEWDEIRTINYHGIHPDDRCGLRNPERGFRMESYIGQPAGSHIWGIGHYLKGKATSGFSDDWFLMNARRYEPYGSTLMQAYCYLTDFEDRPLTQDKLAFLQRSLDRCRQAGLKVLLRFSYEKNMTRKTGPTAETILNHLNQLAPLIQKNKDVIYVLQAGFVGAWGEWHSSAHHNEENHFQLAAIITKELEVLPQDRMIQLRVMPKYKRWVLQDAILNASVLLNETNAFSGTPAARLGFANDGFMANKSDGGTWPEPPFKIKLINRGFATLINPRPVYIVLINTSGELVGKQKTGANPQSWQPFKPGDQDFEPLMHFIEGDISLKGLKTGEYMVGLWLPDADESIQLDSRYAVRTANRDTPWWTTADGKYGANILGTVIIDKTK